MRLRMEVDDRIKKAVMEELVRGREFANQLRQIVFINSNGDDDELATTATRHHHHLVNNVLNSFTNTLFLLDNTTKQQLPTNQVSNTSISQRDDHFSLISTSTSTSTTPAAKSDEDYSQESSKSTSPAGRGCHKRRKTTTQTWEKMSGGPPTDDGHQWRKYGQKMILNSKYARNYYRCTHKVDQRCQATKQVQRIQEKPVPLFKTTYYGHHTCKNLLLQNPEDFILQPHDHTSSSILLSFDNSTTSTFPPPTKQAHCPFLSSSNFSEEEIPSSSSFDHDHYLLSPDPTLDHSSTLQSEYQEDMMMYGLFCSDSVERHDFFHPFLGF